MELMFLAIFGTATPIAGFVCSLDSKRLSKCGSRLGGGRVAIKICIHGHGYRQSLRSENTHVSTCQYCVSDISRHLRHSWPWICTNAATQQSVVGLADAEG
jgi:hypothetical protein